MSYTPLLIIDGSSYLFRAYHALPQLTNHEGSPTGAIYGVTQMLRKVMRSYQPQHMVVVFDSKGPNFRHQLCPDYKANRASMPDELAQQIAPLHDLIRSLGLPLVAFPGVEADDVMATLAQQAARDDKDVLIVTADKDMAQLVNERIFLLNTKTDQVLDADGVQEKFGVPPTAIGDYLALMGDSSDNIPGIPKVGPKTAVKWLQQYHDLAGIVANADQIKGKVGESLRENLGQLPLSRQLVSLKTDVVLDQLWTDLQVRPYDKATVAERFGHFGFRPWVDPFQAKSQHEDAPPAEEPVVSWQAEVITDRTQCGKHMTAAAQAGVFGLGVLFSGDDIYAPQLAGIALASDAFVVYFPVQGEGAELLDQAWLLEQVALLLSVPSHRWVGFKMKAALKCLQALSVSVSAEMFDVQIAAYVLDSNQSNDDMKKMVQQHLATGAVPSVDVVLKKGLGWHQIPVAQSADHACSELMGAMSLRQKFSADLEGNPQAKKIFEQLDQPLQRVLVDMERTGVLVDGALLTEQSKTLGETLEGLEQKVHALAGQAFNLSSPKQLGHILYGCLQLPVVKKTPKGQPSTAEPVLQALARDYPLPQHILSFRRLGKLKSTYTDKLPLQINVKTKRIHTQYHQAVTSTGRLSSSDPNLQNIPVRHLEGRAIREAFIAPAGSVILAADYSQIELRIMAHLSQDERLLAAFEQGIDVHRATAASIGDVAPEQVTDAQRRQAKAVNFGLLYGMSCYGLAQQLKIGRQEAQAYIDRYFAAYPKVRQYMDNTRDAAHQQGYVETVLGRRMYVPNIKAHNKMLQKGAERAAINAPLQGTSADIIKQAMLYVHQAMATKKLPATLVMQVHDELVFEVAKEDCDQAHKLIRQCMTQAAQLSVPLVVDIATGCHWEQAH